MTTRLPLTINQGATFSYTIELTDDNGVDLVTTNMTARAQMRKSYTSETAIDLNASFANSSLTIGMTANATSSVEPGRYVYDVLATNSSTNNITRIIEGVITVRPSATRS